MEGIHPVNDPKAEQDLRILRETVKHALKLLHGPAICLHGSIEEAYRSLCKAVGEQPDSGECRMPEGEWRDFVGE